jgi:TRAP transporter TAXI family solute receptor
MIKFGRKIALAAALFATIPLAAADAQERLVMAGSSAGGTSHLYFATVATLINKYIPGVEASARSGGTAENVMLIERGEIKIGVTEPGAALLLQGADWREKTRLRTLYAMFTTPYHIIVPAESPVRTIADLKGKRVAVGTRQGGEAYLFQRVLDSLGMRESDFRVEYLGKGEGINAYKDNVLDAMFYLCPLPCPVVTEVATHPRGARLIPLSGDDVGKIKAKYGWYADFQIEKDVYTNALKQRAADTRTVTEWSYIVVRDDFPMELGYKIVKMLDEKYDELVSSFRPAATSTALNTAQNSGFALHAATQRYLAEKGLLK